ncbi:hypothetical protein RJZ56_002542 [Blastomyces dermatitidis]|uniref:Uncharacterized protein n=1 Tax=Ajellomyces dermatitidis (strain ER-3 / ATCC MYA-2586) TaxID=559297 RepID=A0ABP2F2P8_AJEDR|nr:uncharacterized protein BDCG_04606 [Blastomyces dermatitidis ER-3]EEQ89486.1 hypothetical protein BDCG_04606 [Blastomyces dermatitidis ER-3]
MKVATLLAAALAALAGGASGKKFSPVYMEPPYNWVPGSDISPARILYGHSEAYRQYPWYKWVDLMKKQCNGYPSCTSLVVYSAIPQNPEQPRRWFGYLFGGGGIVPRDLERQEDPSFNVRDSAAFNAYD